jgi:hypothetical protein
VKKCYFTRTGDSRRREHRYVDLLMKLEVEKECGHDQRQNRDESAGFDPLRIISDPANSIRVVTASTLR